MKYGRAPEVRLNGHLTKTFPYIPQPLEYIMHELLKNAMRSVLPVAPKTPRRNRGTSRKYNLDSFRYFP